MADPEPRVGEENDEVEETEEEESGITARILHRSDVLATLQGRLHSDILQVNTVSSSSHFYIYVFFFFFFLFIITHFHSSCFRHCLILLKEESKH